MQYLTFSYLYFIRFIFSYCVRILGFQEYRILILYPTVSLFLKQSIGIKCLNKWMNELMNEINITVGNTYISTLVSLLLSTVTGTS